MNRRNVIMHSWVYALAFTFGRAHAQTQTHYQLVLDNLNYLQQTGPWRNWNLKDDVGIWQRHGFRPIPDDQLDEFDREIAREVRLRQQQADWDSNWQVFLKRREENQGRKGISSGSIDFPMPLPAQPAPPEW